MSRLVVAAANHWGSPVTTGSQQYTRLFAEDGWDVAYLSDPISPFHLLRPRSWLYNRRKFRLWARGGERALGGRLWTYNHLSLLPVFNAPLLRSGLAVRRALDLSVPSLRRKLAKEGFDEPDVLLIDHLVFEGLLDRVDAAATVYRLADDPALFPGPYPPRLLERFPHLLSRVDLVVATSRILAEHARQRRDGPVVYLPNGVDYDHFAGTHPEPADLAGIPRPRVLYVGSLEPWFDVGLVEESARARPDFRFVLIGPVRTELGALRSLPNVHVMGPRPYEAVPAYLAHSDAGIIPFRVSDSMQAVHPIKVYEYLATGLPVVATDWEELANIDGPIARARVPEEFLEAIVAAVEHPGDSGPRRAFARANAWSARYGTLLDALGEVGAT